MVLAVVTNSRVHAIEQSNSLLRRFNHLPVVEFGSGLVNPIDTEMTARRISELIRR